MTSETNLAELGHSMPTGPLILWATEQLTSAKGREQGLRILGIDASQLEDLRRLVDRGNELMIRAESIPGDSFRGDCLGFGPPRPPAPSARRIPIPPFGGIVRDLESIKGRMYQNACALARALRVLPFREQSPAESSRSRTAA